MLGFEGNDRLNTCELWRLEQWSNEAGLGWADQATGGGGKMGLGVSRGSVGVAFFGLGMQ